MIDRIVVYNSQFERDWDKIMYDNPEIILSALAVMVLILAVFLWRSRRR